MKASKDIKGKVLEDVCCSNGGWSLHHVWPSLVRVVLSELCKLHEKWWNTMVDTLKPICHCWCYGMIISNLIFYLFSLCIYNLISSSYLIKSHDSAAPHRSVYQSANIWLVHVFHYYVIDPRSASRVTHVFLLVYTRSRPMLCYAQPRSSPNRWHCLSIDSHFAQINSYFCRQYGFSYRFI